MKLKFKKKYKRKIHNNFVEKINFVEDSLKEVLSSLEKDIDTDKRLFFMARCDLEKSFIILRESVPFRQICSDSEEIITTR